MGQKNKEEIMGVFFENPSKRFTIREIAKFANIPKSTAHKYLNELKKEGLIDKNNLSKDNLIFKIKKRNYLTEKIVSSGLVDEIVAKLNPTCIILFGSVSKGESIKESDIDLFVESPIKKDINFGKFERKIGHKIQIFAENKITNLPRNLLNNVVNGIKLFGSFKIR